MSFTTNPTSSAPSSSPVRLSLALNALTFFKLSSHKEFCRLGGVDPFQSIHSIHLFVNWLSSLPVRNVLSSDLLLVAWAVQGLPAGLRTFVNLSLAWEGVSEERMNLEYLLWHLEMWRSFFSSVTAVEYARKRGKSQETHIAAWYAGSTRADLNRALEAARKYWDNFSGKMDEEMPFPQPPKSAATTCPGGTEAAKSSSASGWTANLRVL